MKAKLLNGAVWMVALGAAGGCASTAPPMAANEAAPVDLVDCDHITGSRIRTKDRTDCSPVGYPFHSYSKAELEATGEIDLNSALRQINPAFR